MRYFTAAPLRFSEILQYIESLKFDYPQISMKSLCAFLRIPIVFLAMVLFQTSFYSQTTAIPDAAFEQFLVDEGIDTNGVNGNILNVDAEAVTDLDISVNTVINFTGLEAFINLVSFDGGSNQFASLPLATLTQLEELTFSDNDALESLDLSTNIALKVLDIGSRFSGLEPHPPIASLDLSANIALEDIDLFFFINMTSLTLPDTATLKKLVIYRLAVPNFDLQLLNGLEEFRLTFSNAAFTAINLPDEKENLKRLSIRGISIGSIDISDYINLERVSLDSLDLTTLQLPSTNTMESLQIQNHDLGFLDLSIVPNLTDLTVAYILNSGTSFSIDLSKNLLLERVNLSFNKMSNLDITQNVNIERLELSSNLLSTLDVTQNVNLDFFHIALNKLTEVKA